MWLKWSPWSDAKVLGQELVLGATFRGTSGGAWEELVGNPEGFASFEQFKQLIWMFCADLWSEDSVGKL